MQRTPSVSAFFKSVVMILLCSDHLFAQNVGIGTTGPHPSARLEIWDTSKGILIPRLTTQQRNAIAVPAHSLLIFNVDCQWYEYWDTATGTWRVVATASTGSAPFFQALPATHITATSFDANWIGAPPGSTYLLDVATDPTFTNYVPGYQNFNVDTATHYTVTGLQCNTWYYYRVKAQTPCGSLLESNVVAVKTLGPDYCDDALPNSWTQLPSPPYSIAGRNNQIIAAAGGKVYFGAGDVGSNCYKDWWEWDPCTGIWTQKASMPADVGGGIPFAFVINDTIYVGGGGYGCGTYYSAVYRYIPATDQWQAVAPLPAGRQGAAGTSDGRYGYIFGGLLANGVRSDTVWRYNPITNTWSFLAVYPGGGREMPFIAYWNGKLYMGTGRTQSGTCSSDFYSYDLSTGTWTQLPNYPVNQYDSWAVALPSGKILVTGGLTPCCCICTSQYYYYDVIGGQWVPLNAFPGGPRNNLPLAYVPGLGLFGGFGTNCSTYIRDWWQFCPP